MGENKISVSWMVAMLLIAMVGRDKAVPICNVDAQNMYQCFQAVTGNSPSPPTENCCNVLRQANLPCLCNYRRLLPAFGINPAFALALPSECGLETPPGCQVSLTP